MEPPGDCGLASCVKLHISRNRHSGQLNRRTALPVPYCRVPSGVFNYPFFCSALACVFNGFLMEVGETEREGKGKREGGGGEWEGAMEREGKDRKSVV